MILTVVCDSLISVQLEREKVSRQTFVCRIVRAPDIPQTSTVALTYILDNGDVAKMLRIIHTCENLDRVRGESSGANAIGFDDLKFNDLVSGSYISINPHLKCMRLNLENEVGVASKQDKC